MPTVRLTFHFDPQTDEDLLCVIRTWPMGHRSQRLKDWLRRGSPDAAPWAEQLAALERRVAALESKRSAPSDSGWGADAVQGLLDDFENQGGSS